MPYFLVPILMVSLIVSQVAVCTVMIGDKRDKKKHIVGVEMEALSPGFMWKKFHLVEPVREPLWSFLASSVPCRGE